MANQEFRQENQDISELAALYALDILSSEEESEAETYLAELPEFVQEVDEFTNAVTAFAYSASPQPMANLKDRLFQRINEEEKKFESEIFQLINLPIKELQEQAENLSWQPLPTMANGMSAVWKIDEERREVAFFVRSESKGKFPLHSHAQGEEILVLAGDFLVDNKVYRQGERISSGGGTAHQPETLTGCLLFCVSSIDDEIISTK